MLLEMLEVLLRLLLYVFVKYLGACVLSAAVKTSTARAQRCANDGREEARAITTSTAKQRRNGRTRRCEDLHFECYRKALSSRLGMSQNHKIELQLLQVQSISC